MSKISEFQRVNGLLDDGILGKKTFAKMKEIWNIRLDEQLSNFLGQLSHETGEFKLSLENLNYSAKRMLEIFKSDFDTNRDKWLSPKEKEKVLSLIGHPDKIANFVYANQGGNGSEESGDGWKYRGAGSTQLTLKNNYIAFQKWKKLDKSPTAEELATKYYWDTALFFFEINNLWKLAEKIDRNSIIKLSKAINLGNPNSTKIPNGLQDRIDKTINFYNLIKK